MLQRYLGAAVAVVRDRELRSVRRKQREHVRHAAAANLEMLVMKGRGGTGMEVQAS